jgi:hypothetical protein
MTRKTESLAYPPRPARLDPGTPGAGRPPGRRPWPGAGARSNAGTAPSAPAQSCRATANARYQWRGSEHCR